MISEIRYARSADVSSAYQVFFRTLASSSRLITVDKRGTGLSDRVAGP